MNFFITLSKEAGVIGFRDSISSIASKIISLKLMLEPWKEILKLVL